MRSGKGSPWLTNQPLPENVNQPLPSAVVAKLNPEDVENSINPGDEVELQGLADAYPEYVRVDAEWLNELTDAASNPNMGKRFNHHFCVTGETQSGKSTLAGILVNLISAKSGKPSLVIGNDPKDGVSRWLCEFSHRFDGVHSIDDWIGYAFFEADKYILVQS